MTVSNEHPLLQLIADAIRSECPEMTMDDVLLDVATMKWYAKLAIDAFEMGGANHTEAEVERLNEANLRLLRENARLQIRYGAVSGKASGGVPCGECVAPNAEPA